MIRFLPFDFIALIAVVAFLIWFFAYRGLSRTGKAKTIIDTNLVTQRNTAAIKETRRQTDEELKKRKQTLTQRQQRIQDELNDQ